MHRQATKPRPAMLVGIGFHGSSSVVSRQANSSSSNSGSMAMGRAVGGGCVPISSRTRSPSSASVCDTRSCGNASRSPVFERNSPDNQSWTGGVRVKGPEWTTLVSL